MNTVLLCELLDSNKCELCSDFKYVLKLFSELQSKLHSIDRNKLNNGSLSDIQVDASMQAVIDAVHNDYVRALYETGNFVNNHQDNRHELTESEWVALNLITLAVLT